MSSDKARAEMPAYPLKNIDACVDNFAVTA